jgi:hypothetical protein
MSSRDLTQAAPAADAPVVVRRAGCCAPIQAARVSWPQGAVAATNCATDRCSCERADRTRIRAERIRIDAQDELFAVWREASVEWMAWRAENLVVPPSSQQRDGPTIRRQRKTCAGWRDRYRLLMLQPCMSRMR